MDSEKYRARMQRKQQQMHSRIQAADSDRGVLLVITGNGKGKSTSGFGMVTRALGHGMHVGIVQFIKTSGCSGEEAFFQQQPGVVLHIMGAGFSWDTQDQDQDRLAAEQAWQKSVELLSDPTVDLVLLDELNVVLARELLSIDVMIEALRNRPAHQHVVITGRNAPAALLEVADTVSEVRSIKHAFQSGIKAQRGVDC